MQTDTTNMSFSELYEDAKKVYPNLIGSYKPLAIGIDTQIDAKYKKILGRHTNTTKYLKNIKESRYRYNLDGTASSVITILERLTAIQELDRRKLEFKEKKNLKEANQAKYEAEKFARKTSRESIEIESLANI